jgi:amino acid adenylation domain-containing protein
VRGQRVELGEIEYHIKNNLAGLEQVVVDIMARKSGEALVAFFSKKSEHNQQTTRSDTVTVLKFIPLDAATLTLLAEMLESLKSILPGYMIPGYFFHVQEMPYHLSMKLNRKALHRAALALPSDKLAEFALVRATEVTPALKESASPVSDEYIYLRDAWSQLLEIHQDVLHHSSHFLELGGDSIVAIKLANAMRSHGLDLSAASISKHPQLLAMSNQVRRAQGHATPKLDPFALLGQNSDSLINSACSVCEIHKEEIQDIYPCTPFQAGIMAISARAPNCYVSIFTYSLRPSVDVPKYIAAWEAVHEALPILRTRIILSDDAEYFQVVVREGLSWREQPLSTKEATNTNDIQYQDMQLGKPLVRYTLRQQHDTKNYELVLTLHHALYDGWSLANTIKLVEQTYMTGIIPPHTRSFNTFVKFVQDSANERGAEYWCRALSMSLEPSYPALPSRTYQVLDNSICTETTKLSTQGFSAYNLTTICHVAWGLLLAKYENTTDVTFGCTLSGRNADLNGINDIYGPTLTTVPSRVTFDPGQSIGSLLRSAHRGYNALMGNDQYGLSNIARLGPHERRACALRTTLIIQTPDFERLESTDDTSLAKLESETPTIYGMPLTITVRVGQSADEVTARYDSQLLSAPEVSRLLQQYTHLLRTLRDVPDDSKVSDLALYSPADFARFMELNPGAHRRLDSCIQDLITLSVQKYSTKRALQSWDGNLTYGELEVLSSQLGSRLSLLGVGPEVFVPLCFEKSKWAVVAMLGILKAGGAFVPLDPAHPDARLGMILEDLNSRIAVTSVTLSKRLAFSENLMIVPIDKDSFSSVGAVVDPFISNTNSHNAAYAMFTSGSTGRPKGFVVEHGSYCTGARARAQLIHRNENSRVLQFASYGFDPSIEDIMTTLMFGGCICIPSKDEMKENIGFYISQNEVNFANLTPSFAATIDPTEASSLEVLLCSGEPMTKELVKTWAGRVELMNGYGPSETCIKCAINPNVDIGSSPRNIGFSVGANLWIIDPENPERLVPMGAPGELMVEGPCLSRGYLRPGSSANGFIEPPAWLRNMRGNEDTRVFKTGDLVHYNPDGSIEFIGRKDTQVKINGQRTELGEIESQLRRLLPESYTSTVQMITSDKESDGILTACIAERSAISTTTCDRDSVRITNLSRNVGSGKWWNAENLSASSLQERLTRTLPSYMIPKVLFAFDPIPLNINGKVNRREISSLLSQMHVEKTRAPVDLTSTESSLLQLWGQSLRRDLGHVDASANFFDLGGDSLAAIRLAAFSRRKGLHLPVAVIHENSVLRDMAKLVPSASTTNLSTPQPFSLISRLGDPTVIVRQCAALCGVSPDLIEDLYPCTAYQEHFIVHAIRFPGQCVFQSVFPLRPDVDIDRFKLSVQSVVQSHHSLRARIVQIKQVWFQAVVKEPIEWKITHSLRSAWDEHTSKTMMAGDDLNRFAIVEPRKTNQTYFVWTSNHAVFDGWSVSSFIRQINQAYSTGTAPEPESSYGGFIRETLKTDSLECNAFWKNYFDSISCKPLCKALDDPLVDFHWHREFSPPSQFTIPISLPTAILAVWGLVIGHQTESDDAVVSLLQLGRDAPIHGIENMVGLLATSFPLRIRLDKSLSVQDFLFSTQSRLNSARHFQYTHPDFIRQCSAGADRGLRSQTRCVVHPAAFSDASEESVILNRTHRIPVKGECIEISLSFTYGGPDNLVEMDLTFDSRALGESVVQSLMENFELILTQLLRAPGEHRLRDLTWERSPALEATTITKTDLRRGVDWVPYADP